MVRFSRVLGGFGLEGIKKVEMLMDIRKLGIREFSFLRRVRSVYRLSSKRVPQTVSKRLNKQRMSIKLMKIILQRRCCLGPCRRTPAFRELAP